MARRIAGAVALALIVLALAGAQQPTITICHHPGTLEDPFGHRVTMTIPISALDRHLRHGDTIGACGSVPTPRPTPRPTPKPTPRPTPRPTPTPRATPPAATPTPVAPGESPIITLPPTDTE